jgi:hypothetical protein
MFNRKLILIGVSVLSLPLLVTANQIGEHASHRGSITQSNTHTMNHSNMHDTPHHNDIPLQADHAEHNIHNTNAATQENMHQGHDSMLHQQAMSVHGNMHGDAMEVHMLTRLDVLPASGKSREAGFDERYVMESIQHTDQPQSHCAKASRGLMMLDNEAWLKCGGKPAGLPKGVQANVKPVDHSRHMQH